MNQRILYIQYTNPNGYPPLEHSSRILAEEGWKVRFLGTHSAGDSNALKFEPHPNRVVQLTSYCKPGLRQKLHYIRFAIWCWIVVVTWRPRVVYASDGWSYPIAYSLSFIPKLKVVMHEHDSPANSGNWVQRAILWCRKKLIARATTCVCPQATRAENIRIHKPKRLDIVFNCPSKREALSRNRFDSRNELRLWFHGSLVPTQLPRQLVEAMKLCDFPTKLTFAGYETIGHKGYVKELQEFASGLGLADSVHYVGAIPTRKQMYQLASENDIGTVLFSMKFREPMVGASNKPFDYLACGLALLVPDIEEFNQFFVKPGCALSCNSEDASSIAAALKRMHEDRHLIEELWRNGSQMIQSQWNYENQFDQVRKLLSQKAA